ncbi:MAG: hypothetical protein ACYCPE_03490 [Metallibacterium sp.]
MSPRHRTRWRGLTLTLWAMLAHEETYDAEAWLKHPMVQRPAGKHAITVAAMA